MATAAARPARSRRTDRPAGPRGLRWDRITRFALLGLLAVIALLYVSPLRSYFSTQDRAAAERAHVAALKSEHDRLVARRNALRKPGAVELEARRNGMVKPGERAFAVTGLPGGR